MLLITGDFVRFTRVAVQPSSGVVAGGGIIAYYQVTRPYRGAYLLLAVGHGVVALHAPTSYARFALAGLARVLSAAGSATQPEASAHVQVVAVLLVQPGQVCKAQALGVELELAGVGVDQYAV